MATGAGLASLNTTVTLIQGTENIEYKVITKLHWKRLGRDPQLQNLRVGGTADILGISN